MFIPFGCDTDLKQRIGNIEGKNPRFLLPKYVYVLSRLIYHHTYTPERYEQNGVPFNIKELSKRISESDCDTKVIISNLVEWDYIILYSEYQKGVRSRCYKLHPQYECGKYAMLRFSKSDGKLITKLMAKAGEVAKDPLLEQQHCILENKVTISEEGLEFLKNKYNNPYVDALTDMYGVDDLDNVGYDVLSQIPMEAQDLALFSILLRDFFVKRPDTLSRLYTNITSLKREYRRFILLDGKPLVITDLVNSQLVFAIPVVEGHIKKYPERFDLTMAGDIEMYREYAQTGVLYEYVATFSENHLQINDRKGFKQRFFREVFFSKVSKKKSRIKEAFEMLFPVFAEVVSDIKKDDHAHFAVSCQRLEASVMIDIVLRKLMYMGIYALSLHDSIIVSNEADMLVAEELITDAMNKLHNVKVKFKRETATDQQEEESVETKINRMADGMETWTPAEAEKWKRVEMKKQAVKEKRTKKQQEIAAYGSIVKFDEGTIYPKSRKVRFNDSKKTYTYGYDKIISLLNKTKNQETGK